MGKHIDAESGQVIKPVRLVADESTPTKRFKNMGDGTFAEVQAAVCENITGKFREAFETYMAGTRWIESKGAGDLIYLKLVGKLARLGRRATVEEVEEFYAPYAPYRGLAAAWTVGL